MAFFRNNFVLAKRALKNKGGFNWFTNDLKELKAQLGNDNEFPISKWRPILTEKFAQSGTASGHYFHQDLYIAQKVFKAKPQRHIDIGSRIDGFVAHVASFREIEVLDIRPLDSAIANVTFVMADLMNPQQDLLSSTDSISCLHAIEHFGLGRYNDPIDAYGHLKALKNIANILKPGGSFYFSTPIGTQRIEFNAHRVFSINYLLEHLSPLFFVEDFAYVDDKGDLHTTVNLDSEEAKNNFGCRYGCGIFTLKKK